jgi:hypothetical protein
VTQLYYVETTVPEFHGHRNVLLIWFVTDRAKPVQRPYAELIEDYDPAYEYIYYSEEAIDELFSKDEAKAFVAWLKQNRGVTDENIKIVESPLPTTKNAMALRLIPVGGPQDFLIMKEVSGRDSPLGFTVLGYYDLRALKPIDQVVRPVISSEASSSSTASLSPANNRPTYFGWKLPLWLIRLIEYLAGPRGEFYHSPSALGRLTDASHPNKARHFKRRVPIQRRVPTR